MIWVAAFAGMSGYLSDVMETQALKVSAAAVLGRVKARSRSSALTRPARDSFAGVVGTRGVP
jgi:hypothetical protein